VDTKPAKRAGLLDGYLSAAELALELDKDSRTLLRWRKLRVGPPFIMNGITPIYNIESVKHWLAAGGSAVATNNKSGRRRKLGGRS
jgi:hypothetical protein